MSFFKRETNFVLALYLVVHFSRNPDQRSLQMNGATPTQEEKFKHLGVAFTSDGRQGKELDTRIGKASAVTRGLH